jgi:hypothetical protein
MENPIIEIIEKRIKNWKAITITSKPPAEQLVLGELEYLKGLIKIQLNNDRVREKLNN